MRGSRAWGPIDSSTHPSAAKRVFESDVRSVCPSPRPSPRLRGEGEEGVAARDFAIFATSLELACWSQIACPRHHPASSPAPKARSPGSPSTTSRGSTPSRATCGRRCRSISRPPTPTPTSASSSSPAPATSPSRPAPTSRNSAPTGQEPPRAPTTRSITPPTRRSSAPRSRHRHGQRLLLRWRL